MAARAALVLVLTCGCGGMAPPSHTAAQVTLGSAAFDGSGFVPLGGDETLVPGAQGGFHIWIKYRVAGMAPQKVRVQRTARRVSDGALVLTTEGTQQIGPPSSAGYWELPTALPSFMCPTPIMVNVIDQRIRFELQLTAEDGTPLADEHGEATVHCPTGDQAAFCQRICSG
jgi:hypothetical protein